MKSCPDCWWWGFSCELISTRSFTSQHSVLGIYLAVRRFLVWLEGNDFARNQKEKFVKEIEFSLHLVF